MRRQLMAGRSRPITLLLGVILLFSGMGPADVTADTMESTVLTAHQCGRKDRVEPGIQGDVPRAEQDSNRAYGGYNCGLSLVGHTTLDADEREPTGNGNMAWSGDCAYVAGTTPFPFGPPQTDAGDGVAVVDVSNPRRPRHVQTLRTPGAVAVSETLHAVTTPNRAVLVVGQYGNDRVPYAPKPMDIYDVSDCAQPRLLETFFFPENIHNLTISGNGRYVYSTRPIQVVDIDPLFDDDPSTSSVMLGNLEREIPSPPVAPAALVDNDDGAGAEPAWVVGNPWLSHEVWPSHDGSKLHLGGQFPTHETFTIVDISEWLERDPSGGPAGEPRVISQRSGRGHSIRTATIDGRPFALHSEEVVVAPGWGCAPEDLNPIAGPAEPWLTDISDEADPVRVSQFGLAINKVEHCPAVAESGISASVHYHDVDDEADTTFVMASMWHAGLRIFDVRDPERPTEVAYFNSADVDPGPGTVLDQAWAHVRYVKRTGHIWFSTASGGFWVLELEPQLRHHLRLNHGRGHPPRPPILSPNGHPGTRGSGVAVAAQAAVDATPYYCTLDVDPVPGA